MYEIIPLTADSLGFLDTLSLNGLYVCGHNTFKAISEYDGYPIKNKKIAIKNMLDCLQYLDIRLDVDETTLIKIQAEKFREIFSSSTYRAYLRVLQELKIMSRVPYDDKSFFTFSGNNMRCCQYRVHDSYLLDNISLIGLRGKKEIAWKSDKKYYKRFERAIRYTQCHYGKAINDELQNSMLYGMSENALRIRLSKLLSLTRLRYIKQGRKVDRIYHSFSNLSKISRKYLHVNNQPFHDIDIKNCQPLLLCYLLSKLNMRIDENYITACQAGLLYESFMTNNEDRDEVKVQLYKNIYFAFKRNSSIAQHFLELYPLTYRSLQILNEDKRETMASRLQNIEASIFNKLLPKKSSHYFTLFDAIYFLDRDDAPGLENDILAEFAKYGIIPELENSTKKKKPD